MKELTLCRQVFCLQFVLSNQQEKAPEKAYYAKDNQQIIILKNSEPVNFLHRFFTEKLLINFS